MSLADFHPAYLNFEQQTDVLVLCFTLARLSDEENIEQLGREMTTLLELSDASKVVLDLDGVEYVTSSVLGKIITLHRRLHRKDGQLIICGIGDAVGEILQASRLAEYFHTAETRDEALARLA